MNEKVKKHFANLYPQFEQENQKVTEINKDEALVLVDNHLFNEFNRRRAGVSGWNSENRFAKRVDTTGTLFLPLSNKDSYGYVNLNRDFEKQTDGVVTLVSDLNIGAAANGVRLYLASSKFENVVEFFSKDGFFWCKTDKEYKTDVAATDGVHVFKAEVDLDGKEVVCAVDGICTGKYTLGKFCDLSKVYISTTEGCENLEIMPLHLYIHKNFAVDEIFPTSVYPYDWEPSKAYPVFSKADRYKTYALRFDENTSARKNHKTLHGKVVYENFFYMPNFADVCNIHISDALTVKVTAEVISCKELKHTFKHNVWQCLHVEVDADKGEAVIFINGKKKAAVGIDEKEFSFVAFDFEKNSEDGYLLVDDVKVYNIFDYEDYCPEPKPVVSKDYKAVMSVCSLWHEGTHYGWDAVSPYDECTPLMGYYDEGIPESADWETKMMVEHGINALQYCWYATNPKEADEPIKRPGLDWQQHYGYFYGKYSHMLKFCFMWENAGDGWFDVTLEDFKKKLWDYWVEWYFRDDRYFTIDNKPFFHIYRIDLFLSSFGSVENCKKVLDFMREDIKKYGYDGMIIVANVSNVDRDPAKVKQLSDIGFDGICNYAWGKPSYNPDFLKRANNGILENIQKTDSDMFLVPTVATGRNIMGWFDTRSPLADKKQHIEVLEYYKDIIANQKNNNHGLIYMSTWNEYGEGHWLAPNGFNGFEYNDAWRETLTNSSEHKDVTPTASQMARICHLYKDARTPIRSWLQCLPDVSKLKTEVLFSADMSLDNWEIDDVTSVQKADDGAIRVVSKGIDAKLILKTDINVPVKDFEYLHIRMKSSAFENLNVYYTTGEMEALDFVGENRLTSIVYTLGEYADYYIPAEEFTNCREKVLRNIRIDPSNVPDVTSDVLCCELVKKVKDENDFEIIVDGEKLPVPFYCKWQEDGEYYVVANPRHGVFSATNIYHLWNRFEGTFYIKTSTDVEFNFTEGSDVCYVNGREEKLKKPFATFDKVPVLPLKFVLDNAGLKYEIKNGIISVTVR